MKKNIRNRVIELKLSDNWQGFTVEKWADFPFDPRKLTENPDTVFKADGQNITGLKTFDHNGKKVSFVFKKTITEFTAKSAIDFFRDSKSVRNLSLALELKARQIASAEPAAALWRQKQFKTIENIYLTEYIPASLSLYDVAFGKNKEIISEFNVRKSVITAVAELLANLHKAGCWHRDSKAGNFIVYKNSDGIYKAKFVDLDGIKLNLLSRGRNQTRTLAKLAETLTRFKSVTFTDLYRGFFDYCGAMQIPYGSARRLFRRVERLAVAKRLTTIIADSYLPPHQCIG
jgi:hypothetical protein